MSTRRAAPIMRGAPREGALRVAEQRLAAGGAQHSPDPQLLRPAEERQLHHQRFSFQVYLSRFLTISSTPHLEDVMASPTVTQHQSFPPAALTSEVLFVVARVGRRQLLSAVSAVRHARA